MNTTIIRPRLPDYQKEMLYCQEKNTICEATTKAGKTFSHLWWLFESAHRPPKEGANYWWVAPVYSQSEIAFKRMKRTIRNNAAYTINESKLTITTPLNSVITFKSGEHPDNLYGEDVFACVMDEVSRMKEDCWFAVRSTLTATRGAVKMIGNVKGITNWAYQLARKVEANQLPDWRYFKITCEDAVKAGILNQEEIDSAKAVLPNGVFLELYYGIPNQNSSNKFCFSFDEKKHIGKCEINNNYPVHLSFDFNRNPISCAVVQHYDGIIRVPKMIKLENSNIYRLCDYIKTLYPQSLFIVCGDATGRASNAMVKDNINYYQVIQQELRLNDGQMKQTAINPNIEENQLLVNAILEHYPLLIDPDNASDLIFDCKFVEMGADGKIMKGDRNDPKQQADALDTLRYYLNRFHGSMIQKK